MHKCTSINTLWPNVSMAHYYTGRKIYQPCITLAQLCTVNVLTVFLCWANVIMLSGLSLQKNVNLRNKFHFSEVHGSMNETGHMQSKWRPKGVTLTLHGTHCVHTSMSFRKMKFIFYIYTLCLHRFCSLFEEF